MKKKFVMFLIGAMLLTNLVGCADSGASSQNDQEISDSDDKDESEEESSQEDETLTEESEFTEEDETSSEELEEEEERLSFGVISGDTYESAFFKIGWTAPNSNWQLLNREQVNTVYNATLSQLGDDYAEAIERAEVFYDMVAVNQTTYDNINIVVQNMALSNKIYSETQYATMSVSSVKALYTQLGYTNVSVETGTVDVMGDTHACIVSKFDVDNTTQYQVQCCLKIDDYMIIVTTASLTSTSKCVDILKELYVLEAL